MVRVLRVKDVEKPRKKEREKQRENKEVVLNPKISGNWKILKFDDDDSNNHNNNEDEMRMFWDLLTTMIYLKEFQFRIITIIKRKDGIKSDKKLFLL